MVMMMISNDENKTKRGRKRSLVDIKCKLVELINMLGGCVYGAAMADEYKYVNRTFRGRRSSSGVKRKQKSK